MTRQALLPRSARRVVRRLFGRPAHAGHSLLEVSVVLSLLGLCFALGATFLVRGLSNVEARGAAQTWQAAAAWAQTGSVWLGADSDLLFDSGRAAVGSTAEAGGGDLGGSCPATDVIANVVRWQQGQGVVVRFLGGTAHPNSAGSLYFTASGGAYRVTVRLESGLTIRSRTETLP